VNVHPVRRHDREITEPAAIDAILAGGRFVTLALVDGSEPYAVTLSYGYDAERQRLAFHVAHEGRKLDIIAKNPLACASVVEDLGYKHGECAHPYRSAVMSGKLRIVSDPDDARTAMRTLLHQLEGAEGSWEAMNLDDEARFGSFTTLVFEIESVTAKTGE